MEEESGLYLELAAELGNTIYKRLDLQACKMKELWNHGGLYHGFRKLLRPGKVRFPTFETLLQGTVKIKPKLQQRTQYVGNASTTGCPLRKAAGMAWRGSGLSEKLWML